MEEKSVFELGREGRKAYSLPLCDVVEQDISELVPEKFIRKREANLPQLTELEVVRHFTRLSKSNFSVDSELYPLGSCTMKYNPKINEELAGSIDFRCIHPLVSEELSQGALHILYHMDKFLSEIGGMAKTCMQPAAGAHGELTSMIMIKTYFEDKKENRFKVIVPDSAHGTNPASAALCDYETVEVKSDNSGNIDIESLKNAVDENVACLMLTNPNTLGLFDEHIMEISEIIHSKGALLYYDGANMNAILGIVRPGDMGFDIMHYNLHKTFSTPHGGGGPGSGPISCKEFLKPYLPVPLIEKNKEHNYYFEYNCPKSIGRMHSFYGNFLVIFKAYVYIRMLGSDGLRDVSKNAVLNANYLLAKLKDYFDVSYDRTCMHEFVLSAQRFKEKGVRALDIAKRLLDYGIHPPTIYFPLIVHEALMIESTETETKEALDEFIDVMIKITQEIEISPEKIINAPHRTSLSRLNEVEAARHPDLQWLLE